MVTTIENKIEQQQLLSRGQQVILVFCNCKYLILNLNKFNSYDSKVKSGIKRNLVNFVKSTSTLHQNSQNNLTDPSKPVFTDNKHYSEENFLIPIILISLLFCKDFELFLKL